MCIRDRDTVNAREQNGDGVYSMVDGRGRPAVNSQLELDVYKRQVIEFGENKNR